MDLSCDSCFAWAQCQVQLCATQYFACLAPLLMTFSTGEDRKTVMHECRTDASSGLLSALVKVLNGLG